MNNALSVILNVRFICYWAKYVRTALLYHFDKAYIKSRQGLLAVFFFKVLHNTWSIQINWLQINVLRVCLGSCVKYNYVKVMQYSAQKESSRQTQPSLLATFSFWKFADVQLLSDVASFKLAADNQEFRSYKNSLNLCLLLKRSFRFIERFNFMMQSHRNLTKLPSRKRLLSTNSVQCHAWKFKVFHLIHCICWAASRRFQAILTCFYHN